MAKTMRDELRKRREETWKMLVVNGRDYRDVVTTLSSRYDVAPETIEADIHRLPEWIDKLALYDDDDGRSRLMELRENRQRLHQMAAEAQEEEDLSMELKIRRRVDKAIQTDIELSQSLGHTVKEPEKLDLSTGEDFWQNSASKTENREVGGDTLAEGEDTDAE